MDFNFIASNELNLDNLNDVEMFINNFPDFQSVVLDNEGELELLLEMMGVANYSVHELDGSDFTKYWDISNYKLPEFNEEQFDQFYSTWIQKSKRKNNMDEYGNLIFLQGLTTKWNKLKYRLVTTLIS